MFEEREKWDSIYRDYVSRELDPEMERFNAELVQTVGMALPPGSAVAEVGCGAGWHSLALAKTHRYIVSCLDFSPVALDVCRDVFGRHGVEGDFRLEDGMQPGSPEFDLVFNAGVFEHYDFQRQVQLIKGLASRSKRFVMVIIPNSLCYWYWVWRLRASEKGQWPYGKEVPRANLRDIFEAAGMRFVGHKFFAQDWTELFIRNVTQGSPEIGEAVLRVHRLPGVGSEQKSYLVAGLGVCEPGYDAGWLRQLGWHEGVCTTDLAWHELAAALADSTSSNVFLQSQVAELSRTCEQTSHATDQERETLLRVQAQFLEQLEAEKKAREAATRERDSLAESRAQFLEQLEGEKRAREAAARERDSLAERRAQLLEQLEGEKRARQAAARERDSLAEAQRIATELLERRIHELNEALTDVIRSRDELGRMLWQKDWKAQQRRRLHRMLDRLQSAVPERVRAAVRPLYLRVYHRIFPVGRPMPQLNSAPPKPASRPAQEETPPWALAPLVKAAPPAQKDSDGSVVVRPSAFVEYTPKVTVVLPVWNHATMLADSVRSVLNQTYTNLELIVVDDGSDEDLEPVLRQFSGDPRVRFIRRPHAGLPETLSGGFRYATGDLFTWTSADNLMKVDMIAIMVGFLQRNPDVEMAYGNMDLIDSRGEPAVGSSYRIPAQRSGRTNELCLPTSVETLGLINDNFIGACFLYRSRAGRALGCYDGARLGTEDYDYWLRLGLIGKIAHVDTDRCLYSYRVHDDCLSGRHPQKIASNAEELIEHHRQRTRFHRLRFDILVKLDPENGGFGQAAEDLIAELAAQGHRVTVARRADEADSWLAPPDGAPSKRMAIWLDRTSACPRHPDVFTFITAPADDAAVSDPYFTWILCRSASTAALPGSVGQNWTVLPSTAFRYHEDLMLCRRARDNRFPLWDFPDFREPLALCMAPLDDEIVDWGLLDSLIAYYPDWTFLFIASSQAHSVDPRTRLKHADRVQYLGWKNPREWAAYLSNAALLLAPFRNSEAVADRAWEMLVPYLAAGKPILATEAIASTDFADAPNMFIAPHKMFLKAANEALHGSVDLSLADRYMETKTPAFWARELVGIANTRLHFRQSQTNRAAVATRPSTEPRLCCALETATFDKGGLERVVMNMARDLRGHGWRTFVIVTERDGEIGRECRNAGIPVYCTNGDTAALKAVLERERPDLLASHYSNSGVRIAWKMGIPVANVLHNSYIWSDTALDHDIRRADFYTTTHIAVSSGVKAYFCQKYGVRPDKVIVIPNGVDTAKYDMHTAGEPTVTRASLQLAPDDVVLLNVASLIGTKTQVHAISALRRVAKDCPKFRLLLLGAATDAAYTAEISRLIERRGLADRVLLCGETARVSDYYRLADGFFLSSLTEGWSLAMTEAMYFGLPLILTDVGGARDVIANNDIGILVPPAFADPMDIGAGNLWAYSVDENPKNINALADALRDFYRRPDYWKKQAAAGRQKVNDRFTSVKAAAQYRRVFENVVSSHYGQSRVTSVGEEFDKAKSVLAP